MGSIITRYAFTGGIQQIVVPAGVTVLGVDLSGAAARIGGAGKRVIGAIVVVPGETLRIIVGGCSPTPAVGAAGPGGYNGGGAGGNPASAGAAGGYGGGGRTEIQRLAGDGVTWVPVVIAGGGGGNGRGIYQGVGGAAGSPAGVAGGNAKAPQTSKGGAAGTQTVNGAGGAAGTGSGSAAGSAATATTGGKGGNGPSPGGGGGGGLHPGGGGGSSANDSAGRGGGAGGGGGSSLLTNVIHLVATATGSGSTQGHNGYCTVSYNRPPNAPVLVTPTTGSYVDVTDNAARLGWRFNDPDPGDSESSANLRYRLAGAGAWAVLNDIDVHPIPSPRPAYLGTATGYFDLTGLDDGDVVEWQMQSADAGGGYSGATTANSAKLGAWSASSFFTCVGTPAPPVILSPASDDTVTTATVAVQFTVPDTMTAYNIQLVGNLDGDPDTTRVLGGTGWVPRAAAAGSTVTVNVALAYGQDQHLLVTYRTNADVPSATVDSGVIHSVIATPSTPVLTLTPKPLLAAIEVAIDNHVKVDGNDLLFRYNDIERTDMSPERWEAFTDYGVPVLPAFADTGQPFIDGPAFADADATAVDLDYLPTPGAVVNGALSLDAAAATGDSAGLSRSVLCAGTVRRHIAEFRWSAAGSTNGAAIALSMVVDPTAVDPEYVSLVLRRSKWELYASGRGYVRSGNLSAATPLGVVVGAGMEIGLGKVRLLLPDGSVQRITDPDVAGFTGQWSAVSVWADAIDTDRLGQLVRMWSDQASFNSVRIATRVPFSATVTDYNPASNAVYRYQAFAFGTNGSVRASQ